MIIADIPENLPVPSVSVPPTSIPPWNSRYKDYLYDIFHFADEFLQKDGAICLIYNTDQKLAKDIEEEAANGGYVLFKDWWGVNVLGLTSPTNPENLVLFLNMPFSSLTDNPSASFYSLVLLDCRLCGSGFASTFVVAVLSPSRRRRKT